MVRKIAALGLALFASSALAQSSAQIEANKGVLKLAPTAQLPSPCRQGQLWFDTTTTTPKVCSDGTTWASIGGSFAPGTPTTCSANSIMWSDGTSSLACSATTVQNGSVSTAGRSILTIQDTISGSSATSNFLNITGTFPATLSAATSGMYISITPDNDTQAQYGMRSILGSGAGLSQVASIFGSNASVSNPARVS